MELKLRRISRIFFGVFLVVQGALLVQYPVQYEGNYGYYGLLAFHAAILIAWAKILCRDTLIQRFWLVWLLYAFVLTVMVAIIFGKIVIQNKLDNDIFFGSNVLKTTLCVAPAEMLLLLNSVSDKANVLTELYFTATLDLFDGMEMLEVLVEDAREANTLEANVTGTKTMQSNAVPKSMKFSILGFVCAFFLTSFVELFQIKFEEDGSDAKLRKRTFCINTFFQVVMNVGFLVLRFVLWFKFDRDAAIFISKNVFALVLVLLRFLIERKIISED